MVDVVDLVRSMVEDVMDTSNRRHPQQHEVVRDLVEFLSERIQSVARFEQFFDDFVEDDEDQAALECCSVNSFFSDFRTIQALGPPTAAQKLLATTTTPSPPKLMCFPRRIPADRSTFTSKERMMMHHMDNEFVRLVLLKRVSKQLKRVLELQMYEAPKVLRELIEQIDSFVKDDDDGNITTTSEEEEEGGEGDD
jgi:hypothetical protein